MIQAEANAALRAQAKIKQTENAIEKTTDPTTREELQNELQRVKAQLAQLESERARRRVGRSTCTSTQDYLNGR